MKTTNSATTNHRRSVNRNKSWYCLVAAATVLQIAASVASASRDIPAIPPNRFQKWDSLKPSVRNSAKFLFYDSQYWSVPLSSSLEQMSYAQIAETLGLNNPNNSANWKRTNDALQKIAPDRQIWDCWINHYTSNSWNILRDIHNVTWALEALGWSEATWKSPNPDDWPNTELKLYADLTPDEQRGADRICCPAEIWDGLNLNEWQYDADGVSRMQRDFEAKYPPPTKPPTLSPTNQPTTAPPTSPPTATPTSSPTIPPTVSPTALHSTAPSASFSPSVSPTTMPSTSPTATPSVSPSTSPSSMPSLGPTVSPSQSPSISTSPTVFGSEAPTDSMVPSASPSASPTASPSDAPTQSPSASPSDSPTPSPSTTPSTIPSDVPSKSPTVSPTVSPSQSPTLSLQSRLAVCSTSFTLVLFTDKYPKETSWSLTLESANAIVGEGSGYTNDFELEEENVCILWNECYLFEIRDAWDDGMCCSNGSGSYSGYIVDSRTKQPTEIPGLNGGAFESSLQHRFCLDDNGNLLEGMDSSAMGVAFNGRGSSRRRNLLRQRRTTNDS